MSNCVFLHTDGLLHLQLGLHILPYHQVICFAIQHYALRTDRQRSTKPCVQHEVHILCSISYSSVSPSPTTGDTNFSTTTPFLPLSGTKGRQQKHSDEEMTPTGSASVPQGIATFYFFWVVIWINTVPPAPSPVFDFRDHISLRNWKQILKSEVIAKRSSQISLKMLRFWAYLKDTFVTILHKKLTPSGGPGGNFCSSRNSIF